MIKQEGYNVTSCFEGRKKSPILQSYYFVFGLYFLQKLKIKLRKQIQTRKFYRMI